MKIIEFNKENGKIELYSPLYVKSYRLTHSTFNDNEWCITLELADNKVVTELYKSEKKAKEVLDYITSCMESVSPNKNI